MTALKTILSLSLLLLSAGCSTYPPPKIENEKFIDSRHQISFDVPPPPLWYVSKHLPDRFIPSGQFWTSTMGAFCDIIFVSDRRNGAIALEIKKSREDAGAKPPQRIEAEFREAFEKRGGASSAPFVSNYKLEITAPYICNTPLHLTHETFRMKNGNMSYQCEIRIYMYTINQNDTCGLKFFLWSAPKTYKENRAVLDSLVKSLERTPLPLSAPPSSENLRD